MYLKCSDWARSLLYNMKTASNKNLHWEILPLLCTGNYFGSETFSTKSAVSVSGNADVSATIAACQKNTLLVIMPEKMSVNQECWPVSLRSVLSSKCPNGLCLCWL